LQLFFIAKILFVIRNNCDLNLVVKRLFDLKIWSTELNKIMKDDNYRLHRIFKELVAYESFYKSLSFGVIGYVQFGVTNSIINFDSYIFSSIQGTMESIRIVLEAGRINDAYALLRKYYDSAMINTYAMLLLNDTSKWFEGTFERENQINRWIQGKEQLPKFGMLKQYVMRSEKLKVINNLLHKDNRYSEIRERCNGNTHYNFFYHVMLNDNEVYNDKRIGILNRFSCDLQNLFILHFVYIFIVNSHYMASSDYVDYLDMGQKPPDGCENWVAPPVQQIFDAVIKPNRPDLADTLKNSTGMYLV
jgi:hypothetical protein